MPVQKWHIFQRGALSGPEDAMNWGKCAISRWAWLLAFVPLGGHVEITNFCTLLFCMNCIWVMG